MPPLIVHHTLARSGVIALGHLDGLVHVLQSVVEKQRLAGVFIGVYSVLGNMVRESLKGARCNAKGSSDVAIAMAIIVQQA